jgi:hypothetical protein
LRSRFFDEQAPGFQDSVSLGLELKPNLEDLTPDAEEFPMISSRTGAILPPPEKKRSTVSPSFSFSE